MAEISSDFCMDQWSLIAHCKNYGSSLSRIFGKNSVKVTVILNKLLKSWFDEVFLGEREFIVFHTILWLSIAVWKFQHFSVIQILREIIFGNFLVPQNYRCDRILAASEFWIFGNFREINTLVTYLVILSKFWHKKLPKQHSNWDLVLENLKASFVNQRGWKRQF